MAEPVIFDGRNIHDPNVMKAQLSVLFPVAGLPSMVSSLVKLSSKKLNPLLAIVSSRAQDAERVILYYFPPLLCMAVIYYLSSLPWVPIPLIGWAIIRDKIAHALTYGLLCYLWIRAFRGGEKKPLGPALLVVAVLIATLYGITDEYHQSFVPGRYSTVGDAAADFAGALLSAVVVMIRQRVYS